jgi:hypothetical protein
VPVSRGCQSSVGVSFEFWGAGNKCGVTYQRQGKQRQCRSDASTGLCALLLHSTRNRTPAPAHRLSSLSPTSVGLHCPSAHRPLKLPLAQNRSLAQIFCISSKIFCIPPLAMQNPLDSISHGRSGLYTTPHLTADLLYLR